MDDHYTQTGPSLNQASINKLKQPVIPDYLLYGLNKINFIDSFFNWSICLLMIHVREFLISSCHLKRRTLVFPSAPSLNPFLSSPPSLAQLRILIRSSSESHALRNKFYSTKTEPCDPMLMHCQYHSSLLFPLGARAVGARPPPRSEPTNASRTATMIK